MVLAGLIARGGQCIAAGTERKRMSGVGSILHLNIVGNGNNAILKTEVS